MSTLIKEEKEKRERERESLHIFPQGMGKRWIHSYLSPDLALEESVDLLVLAFFIESKPLQPMVDGDGKKKNRLAYYCRLDTVY